MLGESMRCVRCLLPMKWPAQPYEKYPHTVNARTREKCITCYQRDEKPGVAVQLKLPAVHPCLHCGRMVRKQTVSQDQAPGTILAAGRGLCHKCWKAERNGEAFTPAPHKSGMRNGYMTVQPTTVEAEADDVPDPTDEPAPDTPYILARRKRLKEKARKQKAIKAHQKRMTA